MLYLTNLCNYLAPKTSKFLLRKSRLSFHFGIALNSIETFLPRSYIQCRQFSSVKYFQESLLSRKPKLLSGAKLDLIGHHFFPNATRFLATKVDKHSDLRGITTDNEKVKRANRNYALYFTAGFFLFIGVAYASAPLYKVRFKSLFRSQLWFSLSLNQIGYHIIVL